MKQDSDAVNVPACFVSSHEGFHGSIKNFIKDFVVTEIDINGHQVNTVADKQTSDCSSSYKTSAECKENSHSLVSQGTDFSAEYGEDIALPSPETFDLGVILGQSVSDELEQFVLTLKDENPAKQELSLGSFADKHHRANVHRAIRHRFPFLMTVTIQPEIRVREDPDYRELSQLVTEDEAEDFFRFIDAKVQGSSYTFGPDDSKEHRTAVHHFLSKRFGKLVETKSFNDKGTTAISVRLSQIHSVSEPLRLGRLQGNHFDLVVRDLRPHGTGDAHSSGAHTHTRLAALVEEALENVKARGFVNYYGPQRFGSGQSVQSDQVGLALLKEDMVSAVRLFFTPEKGDDPPSHAKRHFLQTNNAKETLALMPLSKARERLMLRALNRYGTGPDGCTQAWLSLPHSMRVFYLHAYCSRVWNEAVAHRLSTLGHRAKRGDLVWVEKKGQNKLEDAGETCSAQIHVVTDQEEQEGIYTLGQVLLPMPGNTVKYPENAIGTWYQERLTRDGLSDCRFRVSSLKLNLPGCYRPLLAFPRNLRYQLQRETSREGGGEASGGRKQDSLALALSFDLDSSCYATICLRETMKCDP